MTASTTMRGNGEQNSQQNAASAQQQPAQHTDIGSTQTLGKALLPITTQLGQRGVPGTAGDNFMGVVEELVNLIKGSLLNALTAGAPEHDPDLATQLAPTPIKNNQLLGASAMELTLSLLPATRAEDTAAESAEIGTARNVVVIGEDMQGRVIPAAQSRGAEWYNPPEAPPQ